MNALAISPGTLEARRERVVQRAITRACQEPTDASTRLVTQLQGLPQEYFELRATAVAKAPRGYSIDGVVVDRPDAVALLQDRYGLTAREAESAVTEAGGA